ncbi:hybrid sensor histidine kinase/response regulator [Xylophilus sp.]|uniref:hybrid sensor histidine kinase/response regulator n=1 Tax=Xylophilus sp. TaxID=2653893 RepID=UPI0013B6E7AD|nr:histidine kinase [Xylophilus sp.]KAF1047648.1 MAG: Oxygen sensor histidine kinase NreB [Xylophilus sp.]
MTEEPLRLLHLEDSEADHALACIALRRAGLAFTVERVDTLEDFAGRAAAGGLDAILADYRLPGFTALDAWALLAAESGAPPFILVSGAIGEAAAVEAMRQGFADYLLKDDIGQLARVIRRSIEVHEARRTREEATRALAVSQRRLAELAEHLQTSIEQERAAIAREIHDDIGGSLAAVRIDLAWIGRHAADDAMREHVDSAGDMLQHAIGASQRIMRDLRPAVLDSGLVAAVQWLAGAFERRTGVPATVRAADERIDVPPDLRLVAYRTAQEALTNIAKHAAGATRVQIDIAGSGGLLTLEVADDGPGLPAGAADKPRAFGLRGLHERARTVDGWLDVSSRPGQGTSIVLSIPLADAEAPP